MIIGGIHYAIHLLGDFMVHIFISYSSKDRVLVNELAEDLTHLFDHQVWYDRELKRSGGHQWWSLICEQIRQCEVFLYALSPQVLKSEACNREYSYAKALGKPILPVFVATVDYRDLPIELQAAQLVDFRERTREQQRTLRLSISNTPAPPPLPANALDLAPLAPLNPIGVVRDQIARLNADPDVQRLLIMVIEDLSYDDALAEDVTDLLNRLLERDDVLTVRNLRRAQDLLTRLSQGTPFMGSVSAAVSVASTEPTAGTRMADAHGIPMVYVPAGKFLMGSPAGEGYDNERPQHEQIIRAGFWLDLTPVTNQAYARFVAAGGYQIADYWTPAGWTWVQKEKAKGPKDYENFTAPQQPRVGVSWFEAWAYAQWRGGRLPTEAEWEWAARGSENRVYPWGNTFDASRVIYDKNSGGKTAVVGETVRQSGASWVGALDMSGNVWEWCSSLKNPYPFDAQDGREDSLDGSNRRALRGGSWDLGQIYARAACRNNSRPNYRFNFIGFRVASAVGSVPPSL